MNIFNYLYNLFFLNYYKNDLKKIKKSNHKKKKSYRTKKHKKIKKHRLISTKSKILNNLFVTSLNID
jgi:hypothetical protein